MQSPDCGEECSARTATAPNQYSPWDKVTYSIVAIDRDRRAIFVCRRLIELDAM